jgi:hypothetical protein
LFFGLGTFKRRVPERDEKTIVDMILSTVYKPDWSRNATTMREAGKTPARSRHCIWYASSSLMSQESDLSSLFFELDQDARSQGTVQ